MEWKSQRELFEENYIATEVLNKKGRKKIRYVYCAPWYYWDIDASELVRRKKQIGLLALINILSFLGTGLIHSPNVGIAVIEVPALLALISLLFLCYGVVRFLLSGLRLTKNSFESISRNIKVFSLVFTLLAFFSGFANIWIRFSALERSVLSISLLYWISAVMARTVFYLFSRIDFTSEKNKEFFSQRK